ncbi:MAG: GNAT family N-acetyltransferase [Caulobacterales bacterium]|nr:GNAT family N-acetyltransferase [Caulobacterales bacterium]
MSAAPRLEGQDIVLRALEEADAEALFVAHGDEATHTYWSSPAHKDVEETRADIAETLAIANAQVWSITESGGAAMGRIGLFVLREGVGEIGIILRPDAAGRGFASKALKLVVAHGFDALGLHRIVADIDPDNSASLNLFLRNGFAREGLLRANWKTHIGLRDTVLLAKLRS